jgi:hypothetical protein
VGSRRLRRRARSDYSVSLRRPQGGRVCGFFCAY